MKRTVKAWLVLRTTGQSLGPRNYRAYGCDWLPLSFAYGKCMDALLLSKTPAKIVRATITFDDRGKPKKARKS